MSTATVIRDEKLGEEIHRYDLDCGLPVLVHVKPGFRRKFAVLAANYGSVDAQFVDRASGRTVRMPDGVAHFLEHKLFERKEGDALEVFSRRGAAANAATSFRTTSFFFSCAENFRANLRTLTEVVANPWFSERSIEKERGIIEQEIRMYEDNPDWRGFIHLVRSLYSSHPVRVDITGSVESIAGIDREALLTCYRNFFDPGNLCLVVSGDVEPGEAADVAERAFQGKGIGTPATRVPIEEPEEVREVRTEERLPVPRGKLLLGSKDRAVPRTGAELLRRDHLSAILLALMFGSSSETWLRLYERQEIDDSFYTSYAGEEDFGFVTLGGETCEPEKMRSALIREIRRFARDGIRPEDFGRVIHKTIGRFVRALDSQESMCFLLLSSVFRGFDAFRAPTLLRRITPDDVMARHAELFGEDNHATSIVHPVR